MQYCNISAYKFVTLHEDTLPTLREHLQQQALLHQLLGTILLSTEGINLFLAGSNENIELFISELTTNLAFADLWFKRSLSNHIPFKRLKVRIKKEIIFMGQPIIQPEKATAPYVDPVDLDQWYQDKKDLVILDTRNRYECEVGTFENATLLPIDNFSDFPNAIAALPEDMKDKTIVTFCTGGIRCEKAAAYMQTQGFKNVWQLKGGILNYFEQSGSGHFEGDCFVFDERGALNGGLEET